MTFKAYIIMVVHRWTCHVSQGSVRTSIRRHGLTVLLQIHSSIRLPKVIKIE